MSNGKRYRVAVPQERDGKTYWTTLGKAFEGKNESISMNLPIVGKLVLFIDDGERREGSGGGPPARPAPPSDANDDMPF